MLIVIIGTIRDNYISPALLATVRVIQATEDEFQYIENAFNGEIITVRNELASFVSLRTLLTSKMKAELAEVRFARSNTVFLSSQIFFYLIPLGR